MKLYKKKYDYINQCDNVSILTPRNDKYPIFNKSYFSIYVRTEKIFFFYCGSYYTY